MSLNAKDVKITSTYKKLSPDLEAGVYPARLVSVTTLGIQKQRAYKGDDKPPVLEIGLTYELLDEFLVDEDGEIMEDKPRWISERIPFHHISKTLALSTKRYYALDPKENNNGDWNALLGTPCMLTVVLDEWESKKDGTAQSRNKITNVSSMQPKKAAAAPELVNPTRLFDFYEPDIDVFYGFPNWLQDKIKSALDYPGSKLEKLVQTTPAPVKEVGAAKATTAPKAPAKAPVKEVVASEKPVAEGEEDW